MRIFLCSLMAFFMLLSPMAALSDETFPPSSLPTYPGIDVSEWQRGVDYSAVARSGVQIVYIRSSLGSDYVDPYFAHNWQGAEAQDLKFGFYHFLTADTQDEARAQARFFADLIRDVPYTCIPALDYGIPSGVTNAQATQNALAFLEEVNRLTGQKPALYTDASGARDRFGKALAEYPLWVANYGVASPEPNGKWAAWSGFQYSQRGIVSGITGNVDLDHFTAEMFLPYQPSPTPTPTPTPTRTPTPTPTPVPANVIRYYAAQPGDTIRRVAVYLNASESSLIQLNPLPASGIPATGQILMAVSLDSALIGHFASLYVVQPGDTLSRIARRYQISVSDLEKSNGMGTSVLIAGLILGISPSTGRGELISSESGLLRGAYTVKRGDTLSRIGREFGIRAQDLARYNGFPIGAFIYPGQILKLISHGIPESSTHFSGGYVVQRGDTLTRIARKFHVTVNALFQANDLLNRNRIYPGQILVIP